MRGGLENEDADGVFDALPFLIANTKQLMGFGESSNEPYISMEGKRVVVLGGGDTAMDCVRTSVRQKHHTLSAPIVAMKRTCRVRNAK
jgi:glutamate synthase (NADPH/NADH) small chain